MVLSWCHLQVVTFAVYAYFAFALIGEQELNHNDGKLHFFLSFLNLKSGKVHFQIWNQARSNTPSSPSSSSSSSSSSTAGWASLSPLKTRGRASTRRTSRWWKNPKLNSRFWQIKELVQRHFWSIGRSLQQEKSQLLWPVIKAQPIKESWLFYKNDQYNWFKSNIINVK